LPFVAACAGCMSPDIAVVDMYSGRAFHPPHGGMRQAIVSVDGKAQTFTTMIKDGSVFRLQTFNPTCEKVLERSIPVFTSGYCGSTGYAFSRDASRLVYLKDNTRNLYLFDIATGKETLLWEGIAGSWLEIPRLAWISESRVVAVLREYPGSERRTNVVVVLDVPSGERRTIYEPTYPASFDYSLSPDGSLLAFEDGNKRHDIYGTIKVLDVHSGMLRATLGTGNRLIGRPCWNPTGTELAYVDGKDLKVWRVSDNATRTLRAFHEEFICYRLVFGTGIVAYVGGKSDSAIRPLVILNSADGKELRTINEAFNGGLFLLTDRTVVCEIGY